MHVKLRYVERRVDHSGAERWCWHRRGHKLARLPDNPVERMALAERLNTAADSLAPAELARGSIGWVTQRYGDSDEFRDLSRGTVRCYRRFLPEIEALGPDLPFASFTRRAVVEFIETYSKAHQRRHSAAVLKYLFKLARYHGVVAADKAAGLRLKTSRPRDRIWTDEEVARRIEVDGAEDPHMTTAFLLLKFTAQRPKDVSGCLGHNTLARQFGYANKRSARCLIFPLVRDGCKADFPDAEIEVRRAPNKTLSND